MSPTSTPFATPEPASGQANHGVATPASFTAVHWADPTREAVFNHWLSGLAPAQGLQVPTVRLASTDASFRRYLRLDSVHGSRIIMDAPPDKEDCRPFEQVARLMAQAGLKVPEVLAWDQGNGFMLLSDLGRHTMMQLMNRDDPQANFAMYMQAVDALIAWQLASKSGVLPVYDEALLRRELGLFPEWYLTRHRGIAVEGEIRRTLEAAFNLIVAQNLAWPSVYVHRDFMPRNLMAPTLVATRTALDMPTTEATALRSVPTCANRSGAADLSPEGAELARGGPAAKPAAAPGVEDARLGILDFQDAVYGPITYDIASLMRDAFLTWGEDFVLDITVRYWQKAKAAGLPVGDDFGAFYRGVEWMGLQRHLKVAGIFARLTLRDGKPQYLADVPRFIDYIRATTSRYNELRPLMRMIEKIEGLEAPTGFAFGRI